jgi:hypothetical protein
MVRLWNFKIDASSVTIMLWLHVFQISHKTLIKIATQNDEFYGYQALQK